MHAYVGIWAAPVLRSGVRKEGIMESSAIFTGSWVIYNDWHHATALNLLIISMQLMLEPLSTSIYQLPFSVPPLWHLTPHFNLYSMPTHKSW